MAHITLTTLRPACRVVRKDGARCNMPAEAHRICGEHLQRMSPDILKKIAR